MTRQELTAELRTEDKQVMIVGSAVQDLREELRRLDPDTVKVEKAGTPSPMHVARLGESWFERDELYSLEPQYVETTVAKNASGMR